MASHPSRGGYDPAHTRRLLVESALALFGEKGFHATSVQEIVTAAGVTKGAFYHHFAAKEDVLLLIHDEFLKAQAEMLDDVLRRHASPVDQLRELVRASVLLSAARYRAHMAVFFQERRVLAGERGDDAKRRRDAVVAKMEAVVRRGVESGDFDPSVEPRIAIRGIVGMISWVPQWYRPDGALSAEAIAAKLARMTLDGLRGGPAL